MNGSIYIPIIILLIVVFILLRNRRVTVARKIIKKRKNEVNAEMKELAKNFIDKECLITSFDSNHQYQGVVKEVGDSALLLEKNGQIEAINLDFIIRIREFPRDKNGKKKSVFFD